jgi:nicotinamide-nucleotide amidase
MFSRRLLDDVDLLLAACRQRGLKIATAESCTGGLLSGVLTALPGSSDVFERGFVTYSNEAKIELLGIEAALIARHGAVSEDVALAMADGALRRAHAHVAASVTGIAGPSGGTSEKPVGLVYIACSRAGWEPLVERLGLWHLDREAIRLASVSAALRLLRIQIDK